MNPIVNSIEPGDSQKILDLVNSGLIQIDAEGTILLWNNWVASHSGIPAEIALGHPLETLLGDELSPTFKAAFQSALACKFPVILSNALHHSPLPLYPLPLTRQRQERIQQSITITPIVTNNKPLYLIQIVDASIWVKRESVLKLYSEQQKRISQQLQESKDRLQVLFEQAAVGVAEIDTMTGRFLRVNRKYGDILGYSVEEMLALDFMSVTHPDDLASDLAQMEHLKQGDIHEFTLEKRLLHGDGSIIWVDLTVSPLWAHDGTPTRHIAVVKDITERKTLEVEILILNENLEYLVTERTNELYERNRQLELVMQSSQTGWWHLNLSDHTVQRALEHDQIFGYQELLPVWNYEIFLEHVLPEDRLVVDRLFQETVAMQTNWNFECRIRRTDGEIRWIHVAAGYHSDDRSLMPGMSGTVHDITERKQMEAHTLAERELHAHNAALRGLVAHVEQMREEDRKYIAREIHDELGQILAALHLEISMLGSGKETRSTRVESIRYNMAQLLDKAIQGMRDVAVNLRPASLELGLVEALKKLKTEFAKHSSTNCVLQFPADLINADEDQTVAIFRIVQESLTNVSHHAKASHVAVTLSQNANDLMVAVHDNGQGFDATSTSKEKTFGLIGMRERVAMLGGIMEIDSMPRQGTAINVRLPIKRGQKILEFAPTQYRHVSPAPLPDLL